MTFWPPPEIKAFIEDPAQITGLFGPLGSAKTTAGAQKAFTYGTAWPGARLLITRATWPALRDTTQAEFFSWFPPRIFGSYAETKKQSVVRLPGGGQFEVLWRGLDDPDDISNVLSLNIAAAWLDEPQGGIGMRRDGTRYLEPGVSRHVFESIFTRCGRQEHPDPVVGRYPKMLWLTGNPPSPQHWIAEVFGYEPGKSGCDPPRNPHPQRRLHLATQDTNRAHLDPTYYEDIEELVGVGTPMARRFVHGHWVDFSGEKPFHSEWIIYWGTGAEPAPDLSDCRIHIGTDPAVSQKKTACQRAIVAAGQVLHGINRGRVYILHQDAGLWSVYDHVDRMLKLVMEYREATRQPITLVVEKVAYQAALGEVLEHEARLRRVPVHVELLPPIGDKTMSANAWAPRVEDGTVVFAPTSGDLVKAMLGVPGNPALWDLVDAAGLCVRSFPALEGESDPVPGQELSTAARAKGYAVPAPRTRREAPETRRALSLALAPVAQQRAAGYATQIRRRPIRSGMVRN